MNIENTAQIIETEDHGDFLQVTLKTQIRDDRRRAILVSKSLIAVTGIEQEVATLSKKDADAIYEGLDEIPGDPKQPSIIT